MSNTSQHQRLSEEVTQQRDQTGFRVMKGDKQITEQVLESGEDWQRWPGPLVAQGVRVLNARSRNGFDFEPVLEQVAKVHQRHPVSLEHEIHYGLRRPTDTGFGMLINGRVQEGGVSADHQMLLSHPQTPSYVERYVRFPETVALSIEVEKGDFETEQLTEKLRRVVSIKGMLDTAIVRRGGNTNRINEELGTKTMSDEAISVLKERLQEECTCHAKTKSDLEAAQKLLAEKDGTIAELEGKLAAATEKVVEEERRRTVRSKAESAAKEAKKELRLTEEQVNRYSKFSDEELDAQLKDDLSRLSESADSETPPKEAPTDRLAESDTNRAKKPGYYSSIL